MPTKTLMAIEDGFPAGWPTTSLLFANTSVPGGNTIANTASETFFSSQYTIAANTLAVGDVIEVEIWGVYTTTIVAPTIRGRVYIGSPAMADTNAVSTVAGMTNGGFQGTGKYIVTAIGASGSIEAHSLLSMSTAATTALSVHLPNTAPITLDTTIANIVRISVQWGTASASNSITARQIMVRKLRP